MAELAIIGLGNPGQRYVDTRHNLGFWLLDQFCLQLGSKFVYKSKFETEVVHLQIGTKNCLLLKPMSYMNESGLHLKKLLAYANCPSDGAILIHDDITLPFAALKISRGKGSGGHNGVKSVLNSLGQTMVRFRLGIGKKADDISLTSHALSSFNPVEKEYLNSRKPHFFDALLKIVDEGVYSAMNLFNQTKENPHE